MGKIAALFPGQGSQAVGMGRDLAERFSEAAAAFEAIDEGLGGSSLSHLCWNGPEEELRLTENTQPALLAHSTAAWAVLAGAGVTVEAVAGHSLGEYSAVVAAGGLSAVDAAKTVRLRGRLMQEAVPVGQGAMAAVLGLADEVVAEVCGEEAANGGVVVAANFNAPGQVVIAGDKAAVEGALARCRERGVRRAVMLPVSAPFHSPLMAPAREGLTPALRALDFQQLEVPLYRNVDTAAVQTPDAVREGLIRQVDAPVRWSETIRRMIGDGFDTFVEVGTGQVLSGLVRRIDRSVRTLQAGTADTVEATIAELAGRNDA